MLFGTETSKVKPFARILHRRNESLYGNRQNQVELGEAQKTAARL